MVAKRGDLAGVLDGVGLVVALDHAGPGLDDREIGQAPVPRGLERPDPSTGRQQRVGQQPADSGQADQALAADRPRAAQLPDRLDQLPGGVGGVVL